MAESKCTVDPKFMNELPSRKPSFSFSRNENKSASCPGCTIRDREIEDLKRRLQLVTEDRNNQITLNHHLLNENLEIENQRLRQSPLRPSADIGVETSSYRVEASSYIPSIEAASDSLSIEFSNNESPPLIINPLEPPPDDSLVELLPRTGVYCSIVTLETTKAQSDAGHALCYLFKRFFTMDELSESSLGAHSKLGFKQLPTKVVQTIKAFIVCNFSQKDGQKIGVTLLNQTINNLCGQARILKKRGKKWKVNAEKEES